MDSLILQNCFSFFLENISPIFVIQEHLDFQRFSSEKFQSSSGDRCDMCALLEPLGDIDRLGMYALLFFIVIQHSFNIINVIIIIIVIIIIYLFKILYCAPLSKEKK